MILLCYSILNLYTTNIKIQLTYYSINKPFIAFLGRIDILEYKKNLQKYFYRVRKYFKVKVLYSQIHSL